MAVWMRVGSIWSSWMWSSSGRKKPQMTETSTTPTTNNYKPATSSNPPHSNPTNNTISIPTQNNSNSATSHTVTKRNNRTLKTITKKSSKRWKGGDFKGKQREGSLWTEWSMSSSLLWEKVGKRRGGMERNRVMVMGSRGGDCQTRRRIGMEGGGRVEMGIGWLVDSRCKYRKEMTNTLKNHIYPKSNRDPITIPKTASMRTELSKTTTSMNDPSIIINRHNLAANHPNKKCPPVSFPPPPNHNSSNLTVPLSQAPPADNSSTRN